MNRGSFLIKQRNKVGLTQADIADKLGYSSQLVSLWEKDKAVPDLSIISQYASILGIDLKGFIDCKDRNKKIIQMINDLMLLNLRPIYAF